MTSPSPSQHDGPVRAQEKKQQQASEATQAVPVLSGAGAGGAAAAAAAALAARRPTQFEMFCPNVSPKPTNPFAPLYPSNAHLECFGFDWLFAPENLLRFRRPLLFSLDW